MSVHRSRHITHLKKPLIKICNNITKYFFIAKYAIDISVNIKYNKLEVHIMR